MYKEALHAHDRGQERLKLPAESVDEIQRLADRMWYSHGRKKLNNEKYYTQLVDHQKRLLGYATFQRVGKPNRNRLILTTILSKHMKPKGDNISHFFDGKIKGSYTPKPELQKYDGMHPIPDITKKS